MLPGARESVAGVAGGPALAGVMVNGDDGTGLAVKLITVPSTVIVSPLVTAVDKLLNSVVPVIAAGGVPLSNAALPTTDALTKGWAGVPATTGLLAPKST